MPHCYVRYSLPWVILCCREAARWSTSTGEMLAAMRSSKNGVRLVANDRVIGHLAKFFRVERGGLAKEVLIYRNFADVVQISGGAKRCNVARFHAHGFPYSRGVASNAQ